jgi:hypothetical protein
MTPKRSLSPTAQRAPLQPPNESPTVSRKRNSDAMQLQWRGAAVLKASVRGEAGNER